jgi:hypothetical protein
MSLRELAAADASAILANDGEVAILTPPTTYTYQWSVDGVEISGATAASYAIPGTHGTAYTCAVTGTNEAGTASQVIAGVVTLNTVTLASAPTAAATISVDCPYTRRDAHIDAEGIMVSGEEALISLALDAVADPETLRAKGWKCTVGGITYLWPEAEPKIDYTVGTVLIFLKRAE